MLADVTIGRDAVALFHAGCAEEFSQRLDAFEFVGILHHAVEGNIFSARDMTAARHSPGILTRIKL